MESSFWLSDVEPIISRLLTTKAVWYPEGSRVDPYEGIQDESIRTAIYGKIRRYCLDRDSYTCQRCGADLHNGDAQLHHIVYRRYNGTDHPKNLITLCDHCHKEIHRKRAKTPLYEMP